MSTGAALLRRSGTTGDGRPFLIRPTRDDDAEALVVLRDAVAAEGELIAARPGEHTALEERLGLAGLLSQGGLSLTLEVRGAVAGHLLVRPLQEGAHRDGEVAILVHNSARGVGLGRAMMGTAIDWARAVRMRRLRLGVFPSNHAARRLYASLGFRQERLAPEVEVLPGRRHDLVLMTLSL